MLVNLILLHLCSGLVLPIDSQHSVKKGWTEKLKSRKSWNEKQDPKGLTYGGLASPQEAGTDMSGKDSNEKYGNDYSNNLEKQAHSHGIVNEQLKAHDVSNQDNTTHTDNPTGMHQIFAVHNETKVDSSRGSDDVIKKIFNADSSKLFHQESYTEQIVNNNSNASEEGNGEDKLSSGNDYHDEINEVVRNEQTSRLLHPMPHSRPSKSEDRRDENQESMDGKEVEEKTKEDTVDYNYESSLEDTLTASEDGDEKDEELMTDNVVNTTLGSKDESSNLEMTGENIFKSSSSNTSSTSHVDEQHSLSSSTEATVKHLGSHLQNSSMESLQSSDNNLNIKIEKQMQTFVIESVPPLHLACTTATMFDSFPVEGNMDFSKDYGLESVHFTKLHNYLGGQNVGGRTMPLNFPVFQTVSPKSNSTVARSICVWLSEFSSLIPPEMDRHLGFLDIPQPLDEHVEIYASGKHFKYAKSFIGFASDWKFRQEVKNLLDSIIASGNGETSDFSSYCIESYGTKNHTVSFRRKST